MVAIGRIFNTPPFDRSVGDSGDKNLILTFDVPSIYMYFNN